MQCKTEVSTQQKNGKQTGSAGYIGVFWFDFWDSKPCLVLCTGVYSLVLHWQDQHSLNGLVWAAFVSLCCQSAAR